MTVSTLEELAESRTAAAARHRAAVAAVLLLLVSNVMANRVLPSWAYLPWNLAMTAVLIGIAHRVGYDFAGVGLAFRRWRRPVGVGLLLVAATAFTFTLGLVLPATKDAFLDARVADTSALDMLFQVLVRIPLGTVLLEEIAFRGVLPSLFGGNPSVIWRWKPVLASSVLFGAWHILPSGGLATGNAGVSQLVGGSTVLVVLLAVASTMLVGVLLCLACYVGRGLKASMLVHWATNSLGFVAAWLVIH